MLNLFRFRKKALIFIGGLVLLTSLSAGAVLYLNTGTVSSFSDGSVEVKYRKWSVSKNGSILRSVNDSIMAQEEIAYQPSLNLPSDIWSEEVSAEIEKNTGLTKESMEAKDGTVILKYRGKRGKNEVEAESRVLLAGSNVYVFSFMTSVLSKDKNAQYRDEFFSSIKVLTAPEVGSFNLTGRVIKSLSESKYLVENSDGEVITLLVTDASKIFRRDKPADRKEIEAEARFGAEGELKDSTFTVKNLVFLDEEQTT